MIVPGSAHFLELLVIVLVAGLRADDGGFHADASAKSRIERKRLERAADVNRRLLADELLLEALQFGINGGDFLAHEILRASP